MAIVKTHEGLCYWRDDSGLMVIGDQEGNEYGHLPAERGELGARLWIEGFKRGEKMGRWKKAREIRIALGDES